MSEIITHIKDKNYYVEGYAGVLAFSALMGLGARPMLMKAILGGTASAALLQNLTSSHNANGEPISTKQKLLTTGLTLAATARIWEGFSHARREFLGEVNAGREETLLQNPITREDDITNADLRKLSMGAYHEPYTNVIFRQQKYIDSSRVVHEWVHAHWRNFRVGLLGAKSEVMAQTYYGVSQGLDFAAERLSSTAVNTVNRELHRLSWFHHSVESYVHAVTALKAPFKWSTRQLGFPNTLFSLLTHGIATIILAAPLAFLMQHAAERLDVRFKNN